VSDEPAVSIEASNDLVQEKLSEALQQIYPGDVPLKFVVIMETLDADDGGRSIVHFTHNDARFWDTLGLIDWPKTVVADAMVQP
jgi:hypothetical protein